MAIKSQESIQQSDSDLGLNPDSVPLLAGEVVNADQGGLGSSMNTIIEELPYTLPNSYVISSSGCTDRRTICISIPQVTANWENDMRKNAFIIGL